MRILHFSALLPVLGWTTAPEWVVGLFPQVKVLEERRWAVPGWRCRVVVIRPGGVRAEMERE